MKKVIINSPSLNPALSVSGISSVVRYIIDNDGEVTFTHFEIGRRDKDKKGISRAFRLLSSYVGWIKCLSKNPDAIVHFNLPLTRNAIIRDYVYLFIARKRNVVVHIHGGNMLSNPNAGFVLELLMRRIFSINAQFIVLSEEDQNILRKKFGIDDVSVLENCPDLRDAIGFKKCPNLSGTLTVGYLGRLCKDKGMGELLEAMRLSAGFGRDMKLMIAGNDEQNYITEFKSALKDRFEYCGIVSGEQKYSFLRSLDVFILPSYYEGLPVSLLETMGYGAVPVTTNVGSVGNVVHDMENGLFVGIKSVEDIVNKLDYLYCNRKELVRLSENARDSILDRFDSENYVRKLNSIYSSF